jgi:hypothetical protein
LQSLAAVRRSLARVLLRRLFCVQFSLHHSEELSGENQANSMLLGKQQASSGVNETEKKDPKSNLFLTFATNQQPTNTH